MHAFTQFQYIDSGLSMASREDLVVNQNAWALQYSVHAESIFEKLSSLCEKLPALESFGEDVHEYYWNNIQSQSEFDAKMEVMKLIEKTLQTPRGKWGGWPSGRLSLSGSSVTGLAGKNSDIDICYWIPIAKVHKDGEDADLHKELLKMAEILFHNTFASRIVGETEVVPAMIPILKMKIRGSNGQIVETDMSMCTSDIGYVSGVHNSFLIRHYVRFDWRVGPLCFFVKQWAEKYGVRGPTEQRLNSYCLTLLVIHYLQCGISPPIVPNLRSLYPGFIAYGEEVDEFPLQVDFDAELPYPVPELEDSLQRNPLNLGQLFVGFLTYYKYFKFDKFCIDMKEGRCVERKHVQGLKYKVVDIIDPIDGHNPGRTVKKDGLVHIQQIFSDGLKLFEDASLKLSHFPPYQYFIGE